MAGPRTVGIEAPCLLQLCGDANVLRLVLPSWGSCLRLQTCHVVYLVSLTFSCGPFTSVSVGHHIATPSVFTSPSVYFKVTCNTFKAYHVTQEKVPLNEFLVLLDMDKDMNVSIRASVLACPWGSDRTWPQRQPLRAPPVRIHYAPFKRGPAHLPSFFFHLFSLPLVLSQGWVCLPSSLALLSPLPINLLCEYWCMKHFSLQHFKNYNNTLSTVSLLPQKGLQT